MKNVMKLLALALLMVGCSQAYSQTLVTLKAYSNPFSLSSGYSVDAKTVSAFSCAGTTTSNIRFRTEFAPALDSLQNNGTQQGSTNAMFIFISEIVSAAKNGYQIEIDTSSYNSNWSACDVTKYFVRVL